MRAKLLVPAGAPLQNSAGEMFLPLQPKPLKTWPRRYGLALADLRADQGEFRCLGLLRRPAVVAAAAAPQHGRGQPQCRVHSPCCDCHRQGAAVGLPLEPGRRILVLRLLRRRYSSASRLALEARRLPHHGTVRLARRPRTVTAPTREVANQSTDLVDYNLFTTNPALVDALAREGSHPTMTASPHWVSGSARRRCLPWAMPPIATRPVLKLFDRFGARRDEVEFHPAWHELMRRLVARGLAYGSLVRARIGCARGARRRLHAVGGSRERHAMSRDHDVWRCTDTGPAAGGFRRMVAVCCSSREYDPRFIPAADKKGALDGHGHDGEAGRLRRPFQHHARRARGGAAVRDSNTGSPVTSGFSPRRCATRSWCWRRLRAACRASSCRASCPTAPSTRCCCNG